MYLTGAQVAQKLEITYARVKALIESGALKSLPTNGSRKFYRVEEAQVLAYKRAMKTATVPEVPPASSIPPGYGTAEEAAKRSGRKSPTFLYALARGGDIHTVKVDGRTYFKLDEVPALKFGRSRAPVQAVVPPPQPAIGHKLLERLARIEADVAALLDRTSNIEGRLSALIGDLGGL